MYKIIFMSFFILMVIYSCRNEKGLSADKITHTGNSETEGELYIRPCKGLQTIEPYQKPEPFVYGGIKFYGKGNILDGNSPLMSPDPNLIIEEPKEKYIEADCFLTLYGYVLPPAGEKTYIMVTKADNTGSLMSFELPNGRFKKRIWFRYGPGDYYVSTANQYNLLKGKLTYQFKVKNTRKDGDVYLLPSDRTQSDDPLIMNLAQEIIKGIDKDDKIAQIKAIHDYMVKTLTYGGIPDNDVKSMVSALKTLKNKGAACEGYTALFNALVRSIGIRAKQLEYEPGEDKPGHSWSQVYYNGKWYLVDVTWDDPSSNPDAEQISHEYFMLEDLDGINGDHSGWKDVTASW